MRRPWRCHHRAVANLHRACGFPPSNRVKVNGNLADDETAIRRNWAVCTGDPLVHLHIRQPVPRPRPPGGEERPLVPHRIAKLSWASDPGVTALAESPVRQRYDMPEDPRGVRHAQRRGPAERGALLIGATGSPCLVHHRRCCSVAVRCKASCV